MTSPRVEQARITFRISCLAVALAIVTIGLVGLTEDRASAASSDRVLVLAETVTGGASSAEATEAAANGLAVDVVDAATWRTMTRSQFSSYRAIILGDPSCSSLNPGTDAAASNASVWGGAINGNIVILGTDPMVHPPGGTLLTQRGVDFAVAQPGKTGAYITLSCYYHDTAAGTPVPLLSGIGSGGFQVTGVGCYNNAHIVAESPALRDITDSTLSGWSCSVHEAFQSWPGSLVPLAIARDFDSSFTASDGSQGPPYILAGGNIQSFPLSVSPLDATEPAGSSHAVTAQLLDSTTRFPVIGAKIGFRVTAGPNTGARGLCIPITCTTSAAGIISWSYGSNGQLGQDTIQAFYDRNLNGAPDTGEPATTAGVTWQTASLPCTNGAWSASSGAPIFFYSYGGAHKYLGNAYQGAVNWTTAGTKVQILPWQVPFRLQIPMSDTQLNDNTLGLTYTRTAGATITSAYILFNTKQMDRVKDFRKTKVATHELGHALGLQHPEDATCGVGWGVKSVMHQHNLPYNTPQGYDTNLVRRLYR